MWVATSTWKRLPQTLRASATPISWHCSGGDLSFAEALVGVERHYAVCFTKAFLYSPHIFPRMICPAMDAGDELGALVQLGLGIIFCIVQRLGKGIVFGFVRVGGIIKDAL